MLSLQNGSRSIPLRRITLWGTIRPLIDLCKILICGRDVKQNGLIDSRDSQSASARWCNFLVKRIPQASFVAFVCRFMLPERPFSLSLSLPCHSLSFCLPSFGNSICGNLIRAGPVATIQQLWLNRWWSGSQWPQWPYSGHLTCGIVRNASRFVRHPIRQQWIIFMEGAL